MVTHVWGWAGSSPRDTFSPWISLKHFSQKWYLSARSPYLGELDRSPRTQPITLRAHGSSHQSGQGRPGTQEKAGSSPGAANHEAGFLCGQIDWLVACKFRSGWLVTSKQANADITSVKKGGREREGGGGQNEYFKKWETKPLWGTKSYVLDRWRGGSDVEEN